MQVQLIRNATLRMEYGGHRILIDPFFAPKHSRDPYVGKERNPTVDLPTSPEAIMQDIELLLVSHLHSDHFDPVAQEMLPKDLPLICQPGDEAKIMEKGFKNVMPLEESIAWQGIKFTYREGNHGTGKWLERMGNAMGFILRADSEPTIYWAGDTIWYGAVQETIATYHPDIIFTHSSGAEFEEHSPIVMDIEQTLMVCKAAPYAKTVAVHLEALDHGTVTRDALRIAATKVAVKDDTLIIPKDGEILKF